MPILKQLYRRLYSVVQPSISERLFFLHFMKCGGTSLQQAVRASYVNYRFEDWRQTHYLDPYASLSAAKRLNIPSFQYREQLLTYLLESGRYKWVYGHFQVSADTINGFSNDWLFMTMLRDPVERWISHYFYNRYKKSTHGRITEPLEVYIDMPRGRALGRDFVDLLIGQGDHDPDAPAFPADDAIEAAKRHLDRFDIVGCLEHLDAFIDRFEHTTGVRLHISHANKNPTSALTQREAISDAMREKIEAICAPNQIIYDHAVGRFVHDQAPEAPASSDALSPANV